MAPIPSPTTTAVPWSIQAMTLGSLSFPVARLSFQLYCPAILPGRQLVSVDCWLDTGAPVSLIPFNVHAQRLRWQPVPGITATWARKGCDLGHIDIWLPTEQPPYVRGPISMLAKFAQSDPPGAAVPLLLGLEFFLAHQAEFHMILPPQHAIIALP